MAFKKQGGLISMLLHYFLINYDALDLMLYDPKDREVNKNQTQAQGSFRLK